MLDDPMTSTLIIGISFDTINRVTRLSKRRLDLRSVAMVDRSQRGARRVYESSGGHAGLLTPSERRQIIAAAARRNANDLAAINANLDEATMAL